MTEQLTSYNRELEQLTADYRARLLAKSEQQLQSHGPTATLPGWAGRFIDRINHWRVGREGTEITRLRNRLHLLEGITGIEINASSDSKWQARIETDQKITPGGFSIRREVGPDGKPLYFKLGSGPRGLFYYDDDDLGKEYEWVIKAVVDQRKRNPQAEEQAQNPFLENV